MLDIHHDGAARVAGYPTIFHNLMVVCLLGAAYGDTECVDTLSEALELTVTDARPFRLGRALLSSVGTGSGGAIDELRAAHASLPDNPALKMALAAGLLRTGDPEWRSLVDEVLAISVDAAERSAAQALLEFGASVSS